MKDTNKNTKTLVWENLQLLVLAMTIIGQCIVGIWFIVAQLIWLAANVTSLVRDFALHRPMADKIKNAALTAITLGLCIMWFVGIF